VLWDARGFLVAAQVRPILRHEHLGGMIICKPGIIIRHIEGVWTVVVRIISITVDKREP